MKLRLRRRARLGSAVLAAVVFGAASSVAPPRLCAAPSAPPPGDAGPASVLGPYIQDVGENDFLLSFETDPPVAARVVVEPPGGSPRALESPASIHHDVSMQHLLPGRTPYRIYLGSSTIPVAEGSLPSAPAGDQYSFLVYGDNRDRDDDHRRVIAAMQREPADFVLHTGDLTGDAGDELLWRRFFAIEAPLLRSTPILPALGNHEFLHDPGAAHFHRYFRLPEGAAPDRSPRWYRLRLGNALFIALDGTHSRDPAQHAFLEASLAIAAGNPRIRHTFVFFHQPPFAVGDVCGSAVEQGLWVPEFSHHHVRAVFSGHEHAYEHLEYGGVRYFVSGGGGAPLARSTAACPGYDRAALRRFAAVNHFLRVRVRGDEVQLDAISVDGQIIDSVRLDDPARPLEAAPVAVPWKDPPPHEDGPAAASRAEASPDPAVHRRHVLLATLVALVAAFGLIGLRARRR